MLIAVRYVGMWGLLHHSEVQRGSRCVVLPVVEQQEDGGIKVGESESQREPESELVLQSTSLLRKDLPRLRHRGG